MLGDSQISARHDVDDSRSKLTNAKFELLRDVTSERGETKDNLRSYGDALSELKQRMQRLNTINEIRGMIIQDMDDPAPAQVADLKKDLNELFSQLSKGDDIDIEQFNKQLAEYKAKLEALEIRQSGIKLLDAKIKKIADEMPELGYVKQRLQHHLAQGPRAPDVTVTKKKKLRIRPTVRGKFKDTITMTFGEVAENHVGNEMLGKKAAHGFSPKYLRDIADNINAMKNEGVTTEIIVLNESLPDGVEAEEAVVLVIRNGAELFGGADALLDEQRKLIPAEYWAQPKKDDDFDVDEGHVVPDRKMKDKGKVKNKNARHNLCFDHEGHRAEYEKGKGTVVKFDDVPLLNAMRVKLPEVLGDETADLKIEANYYYDRNKCVIGLHGDKERFKVVGLRLGASMPIVWYWYYYSHAISDEIRINLKHGDMYMMSQKAAGSDWKKKTQITLRHAAGCEAYLRPKKIATAAILKAAATGKAPKRRTVKVPIKLKKKPVADVVEVPVAEPVAPPVAPKKTGMKLKLKKKKPKAKKTVTQSGGALLHQVFDAEGLPAMRNVSVIKSIVGGSNALTQSEKSKLIEQINPKFLDDFFRE